MGWGNDDPIDERRKARIRELEEGLADAIEALEGCTGLTQAQKATEIDRAKRVLGPRPNGR